jgi:hypothetical protein
MEIFREIAAAVEDRWQDQYHDEAALPAIAMETLLDRLPRSGLTPRDVLEWVWTARELPGQDDLLAEFGQPPITVYRGSRFDIAVLFWLDATTSIHQHAFSGAFYVLAGSSIHSRYRFEPERRLNARLFTGRIALESIELLQQGDARPIHSGAQFAHALFHLDRPSVSVVLRTHHDPGSDPQLQYFRPCLALDPFYKHPHTTRIVQCLKLLRETAPSDYRAFLERVVSGPDFHRALTILLAVFDDEATDWRSFRELFEVCRARHGELADLLEAALLERRREVRLIRLRRTITDPKHRFFLALLINVPTRAQILALTRRVHPDRDPIETIVRWTAELTGVNADGPGGPNLLGVKLDEVSLEVLRLLLLGCSDAEALERLGEQYDEDDIREQRQDLLELCGALRGSDFFKPLFV